MKALVLRTRTVELRDFRLAGMVMTAVAVVRPLLHLHIGSTCPLRRFTGIPCPFCGMTTSVTNGVRMHFRAALLANPAGLPALAAAVFLVANPRLERIRVPRWLPHVGLIAMWVWELFRFRIF